MGKTRRPIEEVLPVADRLAQRLGPYCTRYALGGSIRRGEAVVGDIEIVCQPAGGALEAILAEWLRLGVVTKQHKSNGHLKAWGPRYKALLFGGVPVDVFIVLADRQWGPTFLIRTGPSEANQALVTTVGRTNKNGYKGVLPPGLKFTEGAVWKPHPLAPSPKRQGGGMEKLSTPEEVDVFAACGMPYVPPLLRSYALYRALAKEGMPPFPVAWLDGRDDIFVHGQRRVRAVAVAAEVEDGPLEQGRLL